MRQRLRSLILAASGIALAAGLMTAAPANAIIGGEDATGDNRVVFVWSWYGTIFGACSGAPIAPKVVLTAAHCVTPSDTLGTDYQRNAPGNVFVSQPGANSRTSAAIQVSQIFYPTCNQITGRTMLSCDLAALVLATPLSSVGIDRLGTDVELSRAVANRAEVVALGYGKTQWNYVGSPAPRKVTLNVSRPNQGLTNLGFGPQFGAPGYFAVDTNQPGPGGLKGICSGDSGGPLVQVIDGKSVLLGLTSWGYSEAVGGGCPGNPGNSLPWSFFTNVTAGGLYGQAVSQALAAAAAS